MRCFALFLALLAPAIALAQEQDAPPAQQGPGNLDEQARAHFQSGSAYYETGDYEGAIREFRAAYELSQRAPLLFNIYMAYERLGDFAHAIEYLERFLAEAETVENRPAMELRLARLRERAARGGGPAPAGDDLMLPAILSFAGGGLGVALFAIFGSAALVEDGNLTASCG
ncbi:MAG: tetratricopeptide repeat protein, partial [Sandaracinaceae bacterium]|nr:tetratricopeptide repeat protein [Sandaracinaceae bacterium]